MKKILGILAHECENQSRVYKQANTLKNAGYGFVVCSLDINSKSAKKVRADTEILCIRPKISYFFNSKFYKKLERISKGFKLFRFFLIPGFVYGILSSSKDVDILHCYQVTGLFVGVICKFFRPRIKLVYDTREFETESVGSVGIIKIFKKILERFCIKVAASVITVSESIGKEYKKMYGVYPYLVLNCPKFMVVKKTNYFRQKFNIDKNTIIFLYQGLFGKGRGIENLLKVFSELEDKRYVCVFMGYGELTNEIKKYSRKFENIYHHEAVKPEDLHEYTSSADIGFCSVENTCLSYYYCLPNKFFEYVMYGLPIIANNLYELKKVINENKIGLVLKNESNSELHEQIVKVDQKKINEWKKNLTKVSKIYNWENQEKTLLELYKKL